jgi:hypothetical protein
MSRALPLQEAARFFGLAFQLYANSLLKMKCCFKKGANLGACYIRADSGKHFISLIEIEWFHWHYITRKQKANSTTLTV